MKDTQVEIAQMCDSIKNMLLDKNMKYGDSALSPARILSNSSPIEQILVRIDDKLNRIQQGKNDITEDEDVISDLIGYFVLLKIAINRKETRVPTPEEIDRRYLTDMLDEPPNIVYNSGIDFKFNI